MSEPPFGSEFWQQIDQDVAAADADPEGFQEYFETADEINGEDFPDGDGEN